LSNGQGGGGGGSEIVLTVPKGRKREVSRKEVHYERSIGVSRNTRNWRYQKGNVAAGLAKKKETTGFPPLLDHRGKNTTVPYSTGHRGRGGTRSGETENQREEKGPADWPHVTRGALSPWRLCEVYWEKKKKVVLGLQNQSVEPTERAQLDVQTRWGKESEGAPSRKPGQKSSTFKKKTQGGLGSGTTKRRNQKEKQKI